MTVAGFVRHNGGNLYWEAEGSGPVVVLVHGGTLDCRMWGPQFEVLSRTHRVIRYDVRGCGKSSEPAGDFSHHDDLEAVLDTLGVGGAALVGLSMGGGIAADFALYRPARVKRLVLMDSNLKGRTYSRELLDIDEEAERVARTKGIVAAKETWLACGLFAPACERPDVARLLQAMVDRYSGLRWVSSRGPQPLLPPAWSRLGEFTMPLLSLVGERDYPDYHEVGQTLAREAPDAEYRVIPGVGHMSNMEAPEAVNGLLLEFLDRPDGEGHLRAARAAAGSE